MQPIVLLRRLLKLILTCSSSLVCLPSFACVTTPLMSPALQQSVDTAQPILRWAAANDQSYRLQLSLQTPEQGIYFSSDVQVVGGQWQLPAAVTSALSVAKVIISQGCTVHTAADLAAQAPSFFIDLRSSCSVSAESLRLAGRRLEWASNGAASQFKLRIFKHPTQQPAALSLMQTEELQTNAWTLPAGLCQDSSKAVVSIQPLCGQMTGRASAIAVCP
jgi:hypothetical protein